MTWMKKQLTPKEFATGLLWEIQEFLIELLEHHGQPSDLAMLVDQGYPPCLYFTPADSLIIQAIKDSYGLVACPAPINLDFRVAVGKYDQTSGD